MIQVTNRNRKKKKKRNRKKKRFRKKKARTLPEMEKTTEDDRTRPKVDTRVKFGPANLHTSMNIHLRTNQIKALVNTTIAETPRITQDYGAIPLIHKCAGITANRLMLQVTKRNRKNKKNRKKKKKNRNRKIKARTSPDQEKTTE